jgi:NAD(P)-dependent dehydrogenase (short-subunit alcohol dehydrogenase family)
VDGGSSGQMLPSIFLLRRNVMPEQKTAFPPQHQEQQPAKEKEMQPRPQAERLYVPSGKLKNKVALITGADSGIGRAVAILFAKEGADIAAVYYNEHEDARETQNEVKSEGRKCLLYPGDVAEEKFCNSVVKGALDNLEKIDVLVNNAGIQVPQNSIEDITAEQLERTFRTNIFSMFYLTKAVLKHMGQGGTIINTASVTAYAGNPTLLDYSSTKGAIVSFTRSLSLGLADKGIRVNAVAPGPVWTPLITSFPEEKVATFGEKYPMGRAAQPAEIAPCYLFLACEDSSYMTGQVLHPNGGRIVNG